MKYFLVLLCLLLTGCTVNSGKITRKYYIPQHFEVNTSVSTATETAKIATKYKFFEDQWILVVKDEESESLINTGHISVPNFVYKQFDIGDTFSCSDNPCFLISAGTEISVTEYNLLTKTKIDKCIPADNFTRKLNIKRSI